MVNSREMIGFGVLIVGILLIIASFFFVFLLIYAIPLTIIGMAIILNWGKEDYIEPIKGKNIKTKRN